MMVSVDDNVSIGKKKKKKNVIIINGSDSSIDFYFGHFVGSEDIPQSSSQNQILGFIKLF